MDQGTEPIKQDIAAIRDSMTDKMSEIESRVSGTVDQTVESVKRQFDIKHQVSERPWVAVGAAVLAGYALGTMDTPSLPGSEPYPTHMYESAMDKPHQQSYEPSQYQSSQHQPYDSSRGVDNSSTYEGQNRGVQDYSNPSYLSQPRPSQGPGFFQDIFSEFGDELETLKTAAISTGITMLRDAIKQNVPQLYDQYEQVRQRQQPFGKSSSMGQSYQPHVESTSTSQTGSFGTSTTGSSSQSQTGTHTGTTGTSAPAENPTHTPSDPAWSGSGRTPSHS